MTCPACKSAFTNDASFCPHCGARTPIAAQPTASYPDASYAAPSYVGAGYQPYAYPGMPVPERYTRVSRNLQILGTLWVIYAALRMLTGLIGMLFLHGLLHHHFGNSDFNFGWSPFHRSLFAGLWPFAFTSLLFSVTCTAITGYALLTRQPWGRIFAIVFAVFALIHFPFGTALGIYTLWVLAPTLSGAEFANLAYARHRTV